MLVSIDIVIYFQTLNNVNISFSLFSRQHLFVLSYLVYECFITKNYAAN